jgi:integrase
MARKRRPTRLRIGRVSYYLHHGNWWIYYREGGRPVRRRAGTNEQDAARIAAQVNAQLAASSPTLLGFEPIDVPALRDRFLDYHEHVRRSSLATINRYRAATQHLVDFVAGTGRSFKAHQVSAIDFCRHLRQLRVSPNGHANSERRPLRDKGIRFILEVCRALYGFAAKHRQLPPYSSNPFAELEPERFTVEDCKPIFVCDAATELAFLAAANAFWFPIHFALAKTGCRPGELRHLLIEDLNLSAGWLHVRNKVELGWRIKTGNERSVPLVPELVSVFRVVIAGRDAGPVFRRDASRGEFLGLNRVGLERVLRERQLHSELEAGRALTRREAARIAKSVWRDAGAMRAESLRQSFMRIAASVGLPATCPKSFRHSFATLLQDGNVDPLIRQLTLGHRAAGNAHGALGMTGVYTHTRPETQRAQIEAALRRWPQSLAYAAEWVATADRQAATINPISDQPPAAPDQQLAECVSSDDRQF